MFGVFLCKKLFFRVQQESQGQLALLKADHQNMLDRLVAHHALEHSTSKVSELKNQVKSQEVWFYFYFIRISP